MPLRPSLLRLLAVVLAALPLGACGDLFVDPFLRDGEALSLTGALVAGLDNEAPLLQTVRLQAVRTDAAPPTDPQDPAATFRARVFSVDGFDGDTIRWQGRLTRFDDGTYGQLFSSTFRPRPGGRYEVIALRDDGERATAVVSMPSGADPQVLPFERRGEAVVEPLVWTAGALDRLVLEAEVPLDGSTLILPLPAPAVRSLGDGRFAVDVDLSSLAATIRSALALGPDERPWLGALALSVRLLGPEWADALDPAASNVDNGYGFVGSAITERQRYRPAPDALAAAGLTLR